MSRAESSDAVLAFDLYGTLVDPIAVAVELDRLLPGQGRAIAKLWRQKQLEYSFRMTVMDRYRDFHWLTFQSLRFALASSGAAMPADQQAKLVELYDHLSPFGDAVPALTELRALGRRTVVFSNGSPGMIANCLVNSGLSEYFDDWISVDAARQFKPSAAAYDHLARALDIDRPLIRLVSCNAFDIDGARNAGLATAWVNRTGGPFDGVDEPPEITIRTLAELILVRP